MSVPVASGEAVEADQPMRRKDQPMDERTNP